MQRHDPDGRACIVALVSARGAGDKIPVLALAIALRNRGHQVHLLCDGDLSDEVQATGLPILAVPPALEVIGPLRPKLLDVDHDRQTRQLSTGDPDRTGPAMCGIGPAAISPPAGAGLPAH
jgi:hypothetical protein